MPSIAVTHLIDGPYDVDARLSILPDDSLHVHYQGHDYVMCSDDDHESGVTMRVLAMNLLGGGRFCASKKVDETDVGLLSLDLKTRSGKLWTAIFDVSYSLGDRSYRGKRTCVFALVL